MCGIAGLVLPPHAVTPRRESLPALLESLARDLAHRGPDASATLVAGDAGLAHRRLAILDLSPHGAQPMWTPDRRFALAYNGEVYNFGALRRELETVGERFSGTGDTEVVLRLLAREGEKALVRLDGMFALALLEPATGQVLLARDRIGQKPLYWATLPQGGFAFASELLPLLRVPGVDAALDPEGLSLYLTFGFVPAPWTLRRGIRQLLPGSCVRLRAGAPAEPRRWIAPPGPAGPPLVDDLEPLSHALETLLSDAVRDHLVSDVPVGVLLSGGVDSSVVAALAARHAGRLRTFSVVHRDPAYDERSAARSVAAAIGAEHHELELSEASLSEDELDLLIDHHGDPFADSSSLAVHRLAREMRRHVTVALSGDGGDEIFAGYPRFAQLRLVEALARVPAPLRHLGAGAAGALGGRRGRQVARSLRAADMARARRMVAFTTLFWPEEQDRIVRPDWRPADPAALLDDLLAARGAGTEADAVASAHWLEQTLILPDDMLPKVDRMSMACSLEVRPPLLGSAVLDFAARLPFPAKHTRAEGKRVLRALGRRLVPPWVIDRPKRGFAIPLETHGGAVLRDASRFALESEASPLRALLGADALSNLRCELARSGEGRDPEDSPYRRVQRRWALVLLARALIRHGGVS